MPVSLRGSALALRGREVLVGAVSLAEVAEDTVLRLAPQVPGHADVGDELNHLGRVVEHIRLVVGADLQLAVVLLRGEGGVHPDVGVEVVRDVRQPLGQDAVDRPERGLVHGRTRRRSPEDRDLEVVAALDDVGHVCAPS